MKVLESICIVKTNVLEHLTSNNLLTSHQFGFLRGHSCTTQLRHVMDILTKLLNQGLPVDIIYMDLKKAFDTVPHKHIYYVRLNIVVLLATFLDGLLDFCLIGGSVLF